MSGGARLAIDVGSVRIGVAAAAAGTSIAMPVETVARGDGDIAQICTIARERGADLVFVGDPITLVGRAAAAAQGARAFAVELAAALPEAHIRMLDERLTTAQSHRGLAAAGRDTRKARRVVDQQAAVLILQNALDMQARTGKMAGEAVRTQG